MEKQSTHHASVKARDLSNVMPGYRVNEYLLVLNPNEALREKIKEVRTQFTKAYSEAGLAAVGSNIVLASFLQYQFMERRLLDRLEVLSMAMAPVKIELKDYGSFPTHSIYINVTSKLPVQALVKRIRAEAQRLMKLNDENKPLFMMEPHVPVASRLKPGQYEKAWREYSHGHFTGRFIADAMLLLQRPLGDSRYTIARRFEFRNLPVSTVQGDLFA